MSGAAQFFHHREAVLARQHHVEDHRVVARSIGEQPRQRLRAVAVDVYGVALGFEIEAEAVGEVRLVLDDQDAAHARRRVADSARGSSSVNVAPLFSPALSAKTRPPCRLAIDRTM